jgi:hypothetical protein
MFNESEKNTQNQNVNHSPVDNTPQNVMANTARFNKEFLDSKLGGTPATVSIGKLLTVMGEQHNTIRELSRILGRDYNEQHLHDMHNTIFGEITSGPRTDGEGMYMGNILNQLTAFIHEQNQQIQGLIDEIRKDVKLINDKVQSSS